MPRVHDISIKTKLSSAFGLSLVLILVIGAISLVQLWGLNALATNVTENWLPEIETVGQIKRSMDEHQLLALRRANILNFRQAAADSAAMGTLEAKVDQAVEHYLTLVDTPQEKAMVGKFVAQWTAYRQALGGAFSRLDAGDPEAARTELATHVTAVFNDAAKSIDTLLDVSRAEGIEAAEDVRSVYWISLALILGLLVVAALSIGGTIRWISSSVSKPILVISDAMRRLTVGDETVPALEATNRKDEIGALIDAASGYRKSLAKIRQLADEATTERKRLDAALKNMLQGLCLFDADHKLVINNARYAEIFGIPLTAIRPGMTVRELMGLASSLAGVSEIDPEGTLALQNSLAQEGKAGSVITRLTDGRSISIAHQPMPDGGFVATFEDITSRLRAEERIRHLAHYDALTDLPNRVLFYEQMDSILKHLRRSETVAILSVDLDHFKAVNDTLGHPIGDQLLQSVADRLRSCVRTEDIAARLGGDEFAVVQVPSEQPADVTALARRLIEVIGAPYDVDGHQVVVGCSVGIAVAPADGKEPDVLMKNADLALYRAKADGGGTYRFFELQMDARMQARRALELDLRKAVLREEFQVHYQPIMNVKTGQITSCEALIRWLHPEKGMIPPLEFISIAEETGMIVNLGEWVLRRACSDAARWPADITISVNLSPAQFRSRNLVQTVIDALSTSGLPANRLELEITELVLMQENEGAFDILHQLRNLGIRIAMDDFGTGYSSLGYLRSFPFDKIKIDQSFIQDLPAKEDSVAIVRAVVGLSSSLGITTTAEGVETKEQLASVTSEGCNEVQGYLFSAARPAGEIEQILRELRPAANVA